MLYANTAYADGRETVVTVLPLSAVPGFDPANPPPCAYPVPDDVQPGWTKVWTTRPECDMDTGATTVEGVFEFRPPPPPTVNDLADAADAAIERRLEAWAQEPDPMTGRPKYGAAGGVRAMDRAISYANSEVPRWRAEGRLAVRKRDETWVKAYEVLGEVMAGLREPPTMEELFAELPVLDWSEAAE
jgi:hypothetical protein